jgi:hypothetical protein
VPGVRSIVVFGFCNILSVKTEVACRQSIDAGNLHPLEKTPNREWSTVRYLFIYFDFYTFSLKNSGTANQGI